MAEFWDAVLFGIVEGITEWLPISSTGHMILLDEFVKLDVSPEFLEMFFGGDPAWGNSCRGIAVLEADLAFREKG